jgi:hypothetical protein
MKPLLALLFIFSLSHADIQVTELFRAETPAELEAALVDGYPMPWLAEVLADSTIPEDDRYWLDCRMRAVIAQDLHLFFDEEGNEVRIDANWIRPGEDYWQECYTINRDVVDEYFDESNSPTGNWGGQGYVSDRFGNDLGPIAICPLHCSNSFLSRDGSAAVTLSGIQDSNFGPGLMNLCFLKNDGSFVEYPIHGWYIYYEMSQSGDLVVASCYDRRRSSREAGVEENKLLVFDRDGSLLFERSLPYAPVTGIAHPVISPDDRFIAVPLASPHFTSTPVILFDAHTGDELFRWAGIIGNSLQFSPDGRYLAICGRVAAINDCESGETVWSTSDDYREVFCSRDTRLVYWLAGGLWVGIEEVATGNTVDRIYQGYPAISPNEAFLVIQRSKPSLGNNAIPCFIARVEAGE